MFVADDRLLRAVYTDLAASSTGEFLVYDDRGVERYFRIDAIANCHDISWDGQHFVAVSTGSNAIL